jgi:hypothetical protein
VPTPRAMIDGDAVGVGRPEETALRLRMLTGFVDRSVGGRQYAEEMRPDTARREYKIGVILM